MKRRLFLSAVAALALSLSSGLAFKAHAQNVDGSITFVRNMGDLVVNTLANANLTKGQANQRFRELLNANFDVQTIGRFVLGSYWNQATPEQRTEYMRLIEELIVGLYANRFSEYSGEKFEVLEGRPEGKRDALVNSRIVRPNGPPIAIGWRVRERDGTYQIVDVVVEGVSMGASQRSEFASVIQRTGSIEGLLNSLRERVAQAKNQQASTTTY